MGEYLVQEFVHTAPGEPFRLFPFGELVKAGVTRKIDAKVAGEFRLPHYKPPIKLGSHEDETPAGGHIVGLEVREDGLWAIPEFTARGTQVLQEGSFRYHSPEVIWEGALEDPETGDPIEGPLIVGVALLHTPHLGEAAALYSVNPIQPKERKMTIENVEVSLPKSVWDKFQSFLFDKPEAQPPVEQPETDPVPAVPVDEYDALRLERDDLTAKIAALEAEKVQEARLALMKEQLADTKLADSEEAPTMLADLSDEQAEWFITQFRALSAQVDDTHLVKDAGSPGDPEPTGDARAQYDHAIRARAEQDGVSYLEALKLVNEEQPELHEAYARFNAKLGRGRTE